MTLNTTAKTFEYVYDALGRRIEREVYSEGSLIYTDRFYYNDAWQMRDMERSQKTEVRRQNWNYSESTDSSHSFGMTVNRQFVWGNYIDECLLFMYHPESTPERYYYLHDHLYSPGAVESDGMVGRR